MAGGARRSPSSSTALTDAVARLTGAVIPASVLERDVLASRVIEPSTHLDRLLLDGDLVWVGQDSLGPGDGAPCTRGRASVCCGVVPATCRKAPEAEGFIDSWRQEEPVSSVTSTSVSEAATRSMSSITSGTWSGRGM